MSLHLLEIQSILINITISGDKTIGNVVVLFKSSNYYLVAKHRVVCHARFNFDDLCRLQIN